MRLVITCSICNKILSTVLKPIITDDDIQLYKDMTSCEETHPIEITVYET